MQRLFSHDGPWSTPLLLKVVPQCVVLARYRPEATITRFVTPVSADGRGSLEGVLSPLARTTRARIDPALLELVPELASFVPPALVFDKPVYSAFAGRKLVAHLQHRDVDTVIPDGSRDRHLRAMLGAGRVDHGLHASLRRTRSAVFPMPDTTRFSTFSSNGSASRYSPQRRPGSWKSGVNNHANWTASSLAAGRRVSRQRSTLLASTCMCRSWTMVEAAPS